MVVFEALGLVEKFSVSMIALLTLIVTIVIFRKKKVTAPDRWMAITF